MSDGLGRHRRHRFADVAHHAARHDRLVLDEHAEVVDAGHVVAGDHALHAGHGAGRAGVDAHDAGVRMRAAQHLQVQHVGHPQVGRVLDRAGHLGRRVQAPGAGADEAGAGFFFQRRFRQAAIEHVARELHRIQDLLVAGAAADVAAQAFLDLVEPGVRVAPQGGSRGHHHAGNAVAALAGTGLVEGPLQHRHAVVAVQVVHGLDLAALDLLHRRQAALDQLAVHEHGAGAALAGAAAFLVAGELELLAHEVDQAVVIGHGAHHLASVHRGRHLRHRRMAGLADRGFVESQFRHG